MKFIIPNLILLFFFTTVSSQVNYEKGFIIDNSGKQIDCLIRNLDWSNNPISVDYKLTENSEVINGNLSNIKAFQIGNELRYVNVKAKIDQSINQIPDLSRMSEPEYKLENVFLRQLVLGKANLYFFADNRKRLFFYNIDDNEIKPLVYKKYYIDNLTVGENNSYKKELFDNLKCDNISPSDARNADYYKNDLISFFSDYNTCVNGDNTVFKTENIKGKFNVSIKGGISFSSAEIKFDSGPIFTDVRSASFENQVSIRIGADLEYVLPFNKNKWALFVEPTYISYSANTSITVQTATVFEDNVSVDYKAIEVPIGLRHYMFLNNESKLFLNAAFVVTNNLSGDIQYERNSDLEIKSGTSGLIGLGYNYQNKFSVEARLYFPRDITSTFPFFNSPLNVTSIILGYQFL